VILSVRNGKKLGQFIFPKHILRQHKIISFNHKGGKRAFRIYTPWDTVNSQQAAESQLWQRDFFVEIEPTADIATLTKLLQS